VANKTTISLGNALDIVNVGNLKPRLQTAMEKKPHVVLIADKVERSDTAGIQLIYSFMQYAKEKDVAVSWQKPSDSLIETIAKLGMTDALQIN